MMHLLKRWAATLVILAVACGAGAFEPNEILVSPNPGLIDAVFSQSRAKVAHTDPQGKLWLADSTGPRAPSSRGTGGVKW